MTDTSSINVAEALKARFAELPSVVQQAIMSSDVEEHLREMAKLHKLHLDQWQLLENQVMLALLGFQPVADLAANIQKEVGVDEATATALGGDISRIVFEPIRSELEKALDMPTDETPLTSPPRPVGYEPGEGDTPAAVDTATPAAPVEEEPAPTAPATPPAPPPTEKAIRPPQSEVYKPGVSSAARPSVHDDPYREMPL